MNYSPPTLSVQAYAVLKNRLIEIYSLEEGEQTLLDTLEGETDLQWRIACVLREARASEALALGLKALLGEMNDRKARLDTRAGKLRSAALEAMQEACLPKIAAPDFTASWRYGKGRVTADIDLLPENFVVTETVVTRKPDMACIKSELESGGFISGVTVGNPAPILTVRGK